MTRLCAKNRLCMAAGMPPPQTPIGAAFAARYEAVYDAAPPRLGQHGL